MSPILVCQRQGSYASKKAPTVRSNDPTVVIDLPRRFLESSVFSSVLERFPGKHRREKKLRVAFFITRSSSRPESTRDITLRSRGCLLRLSKFGTIAM
ncbi:hypothetical protein BHE74_00023269 [Ensete ventricosum]|nr:hypothetical protein BHE74_00023269 [Ensete ventricosum]RZR86076.1 hypothetical protein BHM03_00013172 [Ensete ventricosum]